MLLPRTSPPFHLTGLNIASACIDFWHVVECLLAATARYVSWPRGAERRNLAAAMGQFTLSRKKPVGIVDGTAQYIRRPGLDEPLFYSGRKKRHFLNHLVFCDWRGRILAVRAGFTGRTHDGVCYRECDLFKEPGSFFARDETLLADCGFQACNLLTPLPQRGQLSNRQLAYNRLVRRHRVVVEFLFGALKAKFGMLSGIWRHRLPMASPVFILCCQLMNAYMQFNRKFIRGATFQGNEALAEWEVKLLQRFGGDYANTNRFRVEQFFESEEGRNLIRNF
jgi:hypothetical protein